MKVSIYDYANREVKVNLPVDKIEDIASIYVTIISGDEIVAFIFKDHNGVMAESSQNRILDFYDGSYEVDTPEKIKKWIEFDYTNAHVISYARQEAFDPLYNEDEEEEAQSSFFSSQTLNI